MKRFLGIAIVALVLGGFTAIGGSDEVQAQEQCDKREKVINLLEKKYKEFPVAIGVTSLGSLLEVFSTDEGETFSVIITTPEGVSCLVSSGEGLKMYNSASHSLDPKV